MLITYTKGYWRLMRAVLLTLRLCFAFTSEPLSTQFVFSGRDLTTALTSPMITTAVIMQDIVVAGSDWEGVDTPVPLMRSFTITGNSSAQTPDVYPMLDLGYVSRKIRLGNSVNFTLRSVIIKRFRYWSHNVAPGFDLIAPCRTGDTALLDISETLLIFSACYPPKYMLEAAARSTRPDSFPGVNKLIASLPQPDCRNTTYNGVDEDGLFVPINRRCWPQRGRSVDLVLLGSDFVAKTTVPNGYIARLYNTSYVCEEPLPEWCLAELGPVGCWYAWIEGTLNLTTRTPAPPDVLGNAVPGPPVDSPHETSRRRDAILLGSILGGIALVATIALGALIVLRRTGIGKRWRLPNNKESPGLRTPAEHSSSSSTSKEGKVDMNGECAEERLIRASKSPHLVLALIPDDAMQKDSGDDERMPGQGEVISANVSIFDEQHQVTDTGALAIETEALGRFA